MRKLLFLVVVLFMIGARSIHACECVEVGPKHTAKQWLKNLDGVAFTGQVIDVAVVEESDTLRREATFEVEEIWKGDLPAQMKVRTGVGGGDCGISFVKGKRYFVEATLWHGYLSTNYCGKTVEYASAEKLLRKLGKGKRQVRHERKDTPQ